MAYTIVKTSGGVISVADGTINTADTSLSLPGRNYSGYGQAVDTNFVHQLQNFAGTTVPPNPLIGQLWFNTTSSKLCVCPSDGETVADNWLVITTSSSGGVTYFDDVVVNGNLTVIGNTHVTDFDANIIYCNYLTTNTYANLAHTDITGGASITGTLVTNTITTGSATTSGTITGQWTVTGGDGSDGANAIVFNSGGIYISNSSGANLFGIKTDKYMYANGAPVNFYSNSNVASYLPTYTGTVGSGATFNGVVLTTGSSGTTGTITGNWSLSVGSRLTATYADLAERFEADAVYDPGTVVEMGGEKEITAVQYELSEDVFGVVSDTAAYLMNAAAGNDETHPPIAVGGRVKVKVTGKVRKGQRLVSAGEGIARAAKPGEATAFNVIGRALVNKTVDEVGIVEAFVSIKG